MRDHGKAIGVLLVLALLGYLLSDSFFQHRVATVQSQPGPSQSTSPPVPLFLQMMQYGYAELSSVLDDTYDLFVYCPTPQECDDAADYVTHPPLFVTQEADGTPDIDSLYVLWPTGYAGASMLGWAQCSRPGGLWLANLADLRQAWAFADQARQQIPGYVAANANPLTEEFDQGTVQVGDWSCAWYGIGLAGAPLGQQ